MSYIAFVFTDGGGEPPEQGTSLWGSCESLASPFDSDSFLEGLRDAYMTGGALTGIAALTSCVRSKDRK